MRLQAARIPRFPRSPVTPVACGTLEEFPASRAHQAPTAKNLKNSPETFANRFRLHASIQLPEKNLFAKVVFFEFFAASTPEHRARGWRGIPSAISAEIAFVPAFCRNRFRSGFLQKIRG